MSDRKKKAMHNQIKKAATAQTLDVSQQAKDSVTLCACDGCTNPARPNGKFCSNACRQKNYRKSPAYVANLDLHSAARFIRRRDHQALKSAYKAFVPQTGLYCGPNNSSVPRTTPPLTDEHFSRVTDNDVQLAAERRQKKEQQ
jgi:hypothetical protein